MRTLGARAGDRRGAAVGVMSEILVGSIARGLHAIGLSEFFIGVIVVAIVGNAAEHWVAVLVALQGQDGPRGQHRDRLRAPRSRCSSPRCWCCASFVHRPGADAAGLQRLRAGAAILLAVLIANQVTHEGESTWFEGVQLLARLRRSSASPSTSRS